MNIIIMIILIWLGIAIGFYVAMQIEEWILGRMNNKKLMKNIKKIDKKKELEILDVDSFENDEIKKRAKEINDKLKKAIKDGKNERNI